MPRLLTRVSLLVVVPVVLALALAAPFLLQGASSTSNRASAAGPFHLDGVAEANLTADLDPPNDSRGDVHSLCRFRMETSGSTANIRAMCYVATKAVGQVDVNEDGVANASDDLANAELNGTDQVDIIDGKVDVNEDAAVDTSDDLSNVVLNLSPSGTDQVDIIDGVVDVDESGVIDGADVLPDVVLDLVPSGTDQVDILNGPAPPAPPPPPYSALLPIVNSQVLSGTIGGGGSTTLDFSPSLCVPVDSSSDPDDIADSGLNIDLTTTAGKDGTMGASSVVLNFDRGPDDPFDCNEVNDTTTTGFTPTSLAMNHDSDVWAAGMTGADGCTTWEELGTAQGVGGDRDPFNYWDFMDQYTGAPPARDKIVAVGDIGAVVGMFGTAGSPNGDPTIAPVSGGMYHTSGDRNGSIPGGEPWDFLPPNGNISVGDIGAVVAEFGHSCIMAPN